MNPLQPKHRLEIAKCKSKSQVKRVACLRGIDEKEALTLFQQFKSAWETEAPPPPPGTRKQPEPEVD